jgi:hypothetical protein
VARTPGTGGVWAVDYFRVYSDIIDNPKFAAAPEDGGISAEAFRFWMWCLCIASSSPDRDGKLPPLVEIAFRCRVTLQQADAFLAALQSRKLVSRDSSGRHTIVGWSTFQPLVPKSTQRVRKHRASRKVAPSNPAQPSPVPDETRFIAFHETGETRCETFLKRDETLLIDREKPPTESSSSSAAHPKTNPPSSANPPHPPRGAARGVGGLDDDEPFAAPPEPAVDLDPVTLPPEVADVERLADELFPSGGMSTSARRACLSGVKPAWVAEALRVARDAGASRWAYVARILARWAEAGVSDAERGKARADPAPFTGRHKVPLSERIKRAEAAEARRRAEDLAREGRHDGGTGGGLVPEVR